MRRGAGIAPSPFDRVPPDGTYNAGAMHVTRRGKIAVSALAGAAAVLAAALGLSCSSGDDTPGSATLQQRVRNNELIAYTVTARELTTPGGGLRLVWAIGVFDPQQGRHIGSFEVGGLDESPIQATLAGDEIVFNMGDRIEAYGYDGSGRRVVYETAAGGQILGIASSPDGGKLALAEQIEDPCPVAGEPCKDFRDVTRVRVIDLHNGKIQFDIGADDASFAAFPGRPQFVTWRADGRGVVVEGHTGDESPAVFATVMLDDRTVTVEDSRGFWLKIAPSGEAMLHTPEETCGGLNLSVERHELSVTELVTGRELAALSDGTLSFIPVAWSPDGSQLMYKTYTAVPDAQLPECPAIDPATVRWHTLDLATGASADSADRYAIEQSWYGDAVLEFRCRDEPVEEPADCIGDGHALPVDLYADGVLVASGTDFRRIVEAPRW